MEALDAIIGKIGAFAWGPPMLILLVGTGCWLTYSLRGLQFTKLGHALYLALIKRKEDGDEPGDITHFQALMTALSATVGTGNIAGVATAIAIGGPGALFWMWITGLVLILTGAWSNGQNGAELTTTAFALGMPMGNYIVTLGLVLFAYSTILGWSYYGEKSIEYLFGVRSVMPYRIVFVLFVGVGAVAKLSIVWNISDALNGLMAIPNLIGLIMLTPVIVSETKKYFNNTASK